LEDKFDEDMLEDEAKQSDGDDMDVDGAAQFEGVPALGDSVLKLWQDNAKILESDFAICGWYLCVFYRMMDCVRDNDTSAHREAVARVIEGL
jgi:hypothetical protein